MLAATVFAFAVLSADSLIAPESFIAPGASIVKEPGDYLFTEGPLMLKDGRVIFSDIPANKIYSLKDGKVTVFREPSDNANGNFLDGAGNVITCEHGSRKVTRTDSSGKVSTVVDQYEGKKLNSPNDVYLSKKGRIYFTDPPYGIRPNQQEQAYNGVYLLAGDKLTLLAKDFNRPNGIVLSPNEKVLYVADSAKGHIRSFGVLPDGTVDAGKIFVETPGPDGIRVDSVGRVWSASSNGVNVISPEGQILEVIKFPETPSNLCFSRDGKTLYVTARKGFYSLKVTVKGIAP